MKGPCMTKTGRGTGSQAQPRAGLRAVARDGKRRDSTDYLRGKARDSGRGR